MEQKGVDSPRHFVIYTYDLSSLTSSKKVRFVYLLKGRKRDRGIIKKFKGRFLGPAVFLLPITFDAEMQEILSKWNISYKREEVILI